MGEHHRHRAAAWGRAVGRPRDKRVARGGLHGRHEAQVAGVGERVEVLPDRLLIYADDGDGAAAEVMRRGLTPLSALVRRATLEDVFLHLTGRTLID